jgi:rubrerythrin
MEPISRSHENGTECEDAVSRKDVIDLFKRGAEIIAKAKGISVEDMPHNGLDALMNLPSVTPKRKTGKWIVHYECPKCGEITKDFTECCPFCGAEMDGKE